MQDPRPGWCHCMASTYGTWLPGDPRGFRTRDHREHVDGDYKSPPTTDYTPRHEAAKRNLTKPPVVLSPAARQVVCRSIVHALTDVHKIELLAVAVAEKHLHLLAMFPASQKPTDSIRGLRATDPVRHFIGIAKKESAKRLVEHEFVHRDSGGVWARKGKIVRITDRSHQLNVYRYIMNHHAEGAAVWTFKADPKETDPDLQKPTD